MNEPTLVENWEEEGKSKVKGESYEGAIGSLRPLAVTEDFSHLKGRHSKFCLKCYRWGLHFFRFCFCSFLCCARSLLWCAGLSCSWAWGILVPCCCSVAQLCLIPCSPIDCSTPGFPILHHLPEFAQTHVHWVGDAIQPSHPLSSPSSPAFSLFQHQSLFQWVRPGMEPTFPELEGEFLITGPSGKSQGPHV